MTARASNRARVSRPRTETEGRPRPEDVATAGIIDALRAFTSAMDRYIDVHGGVHHLHRTDLHALAHVMDARRQGHEVSPGNLAAALNLSSPATSALLARLESSGHLERTHSATDRRRVSVDITDTALTVGVQIFGPLGTAIRDLAAALSEEERRTVLDFLRRVVEVTDELATEVRTDPAT